MMPVRAALAAALCVAAAPASAVNGATRPVKVTGGEIVGAHAGTLKTYFGVPYAAPPVGDLRWRAPQPVVPWRGIRQARSFSPACAQPVDWIIDPKSEDCLYLNVWAPDKAANLPVLVWIHGGGFYGGSGAQPDFDGSNLARRGVIVVTLNYRLWLFGFFAHPELTAESPDHASGNQGIHDQIAALRWVKANIAAFGGDPGRVTIMGQSAGSASVGALVASPLAKGLFQRAIAQSGNAALPASASQNSRFDQQAFEAKGQAFAAAAGAARLADLRAMSAEALLKRGWQPQTTVDGHVLREDLATMYRNHRQNDVPILMGWNAEEGKDLAPNIPAADSFTAAGYHAAVSQLMGQPPGAPLLAAYPGDTAVQARDAIHRLTNDWLGWRMWNWASLQAKYGRAKSYMYYFAHRPAEPVTPCTYGCGAGHSAELPFVFDQLDLDGRRWSKADRQLAARLADTWTNFARTGDPNGKGLPAWPAFDGSHASVMRIGSAEEVKERGALPDFSVFPSFQP